MVSGGLVFKTSGGRGCTSGNYLRLTEQSERSGGEAMRLQRWHCVFVLFQEFQLKVSIGLLA